MIGIQTIAFIVSHWQAKRFIPGNMNRDNNRRLNLFFGTHEQWLWVFNQGNFLEINLKIFFLGFCFSIQFCFRHPVRTWVAFWGIWGKDHYYWCLKLYQTLPSRYITNYIAIIICFSVNPLLNISTIERGLPGLVSHNNIITLNYLHILLQ